MLSLGLLHPHCGGPSAGAVAPTGVATPAAPAPTAAASVCTVGAASGSGPITDPNGPFFHQVVLANTGDGLSISDSRVVIDHASVPDGVRLLDGTLRIYYVNGQDGTIGIARVDGETVSVIGPLTMNGVRGASGMADPDAVLMPDGRIRLYYLNGFGPPGGAVRGMCFADSTDGERFTVGGLAIQFSNPETVTDPSVTRLSTGTWLMAASRGQQSLLARSSDGATFSNETTVGLGGVPELTALAEGRVRIYVCAQGFGIVAHASADEGRTWTRESTMVPQGILGARTQCDPSLVAGTSRFIYKIQP